MKKIQLIFLFVFIGLLTACGTREPETEELAVLEANQIYTYFVNADKTDIVSETYTIKSGKDILKNADEVIGYLENTEADTDYQTPIPEGITYIESKPGSRHGSLEVAFNVLYDSVDAESLLFFKACTVKSLMQIEGVDSVTLSLTDVANVNEDTATVSENFDADSFNMSFGNESRYKQKGTIVLYFANESGEALKEYRKTVEISNNTSLARIVIEALINGPEGKGYTATISDKTTIQNLSVKDGICYVDLSDEFYDTNNSLKNDIIVYSVVNSLVELPTVSKVQFLKSGEKQQFFRETMPFDGIFERNLDLIEQEESEE